jgi:hypothetical protein
MKRLLIALVFALGLLFAGLYLWRPSAAPGGQPALLTLGTANFGEFENAFDAGSDSARLVLLLSPT